ncbi:MAG TPA: hypothetical protein VL442_02970 [Mucilaginibacter sp.]|jgi:hypothetical protein|nr:hypothetical protein [Mucilaginibacter sp.]
MSKLEQYYRFNEVAGVHLHIHPDGGTAIQVCTVKATGNQLQIEKKITDLTSMGQLKAQLLAKSLIALNLSGKGILQKRIDKIATIDQNAFNKILPNAKVEDFYVQNFISGEASFVSLIRKAEADRWIDALIDLQLTPLTLSLGPFAVDTIITQLNIYENEFIIGGHQVSRNEKNEWLDYQYHPSLTSSFPIKVASEKIDEKLIIPYAAAFQLVLINSIEPVQANADRLDNVLQKRLSDQKIKVQGAIVLMAIFILLLINFVLFSWLNSSNNTLSEQVSRYTQNSSNQQELNLQVKQKEMRLKALGWDGGINKSTLIDQLASLLPTEVTLKEIAINPIELVNSRTQKSLVFYDRKIWITGISEKIIPVNEWIARIKTRHWIKNIQLENYAFNSELNTGQFTITIDY